MGYLHNFIYNIAIQYAGHKSGAYPLNLVKTRLAPRQYGRIRGFKADNLNRRSPCFQYFPHPGYRAPGAYAGNKIIHIPIRISPDLFGSGLTVDFRIGGIVELLGDETVFYALP